MTGIIGYVGASHCVKKSAACVSEVSGIEVNSWTEASCQLTLKAPQKNVGYEFFTDERLRIDIYGDIFSIKGQLTPENCWAPLIAETYLAGNLPELAKRLNGYFVFTVFDKSSGQLVIVNDRYGLKPMYLWREHNKLLGFSSEIKGLALHGKCEQKLDADALNTFIDVGHFLGKQTLFADITRMPPASMLCIDTLSQSSELTGYWQWSLIAKDNEITFEQAVDDLYGYFEQAMQRTFATVTQDTIAITLSGGLDSRILLAAAKKHFNGEILTYTFGEQGCDDALLATQVSELAEVNNQFISINSDNWFDGREQGVWLTDGLKNILHMHGLSVVEEISPSSNYLVNGYLGDVTLGGSYLFPTDKNAMSLADKVGERYGKHKKHADFDSQYFANAGSDPAFIYNRGVRHIGAGSDLLSHKLHNFKPFLDNDMVEFLYSLPDDFRRDGKIYHHMLLKYYPEYFSIIPWQQTGKPISKQASVKVPKGKSLKQLIVSAIKGSPIDAFSRKIYQKLSGKQNYVAYDTWLRLPDFKQYVYSTLLAKESYICQHLSRKRVEEIIERYYKGDSSTKPEMIGSLLTLELYLTKLAKTSEKL